MLSNKLTFSLVLVVMLAFAFAATPVMAQTAVNVGAVAKGRICRRSTDYG